LIFSRNKKIPINQFFPTDFVDIHSHFLPGIDDGAKDIEDSISLIKTMRSYGIKNIITTPHILGNVWPNNSTIIKSKLVEVKDALIANNITDVRLHASAEYLLDETFYKLLKANDLLTLKDNFILVELSYFNPPANLYDILFEIRIEGYIPVIAHPERYLFYHNNLSQYDKLKLNGCKFQLNLLSLMGHYGKDIQKMANYLLKKNYIDFVGSDAHNTYHLHQLKKISNSNTLKLLTPILKNNSFFKS